jgi:hypothetical protein
MSGESGVHVPTAQAAPPTAQTGKQVPPAQMPPGAQAHGELHGSPTGALPGPAQNVMPVSTPVPIRSP